MLRIETQTFTDPDKALEFVKEASAPSQKTHTKGEELPGLDKVAALVANGSGFREAIRRMHRYEKTISEVEE